MSIRKFLAFALLIILGLSCSNEPKYDLSLPQFEVLDVSETHIDFENTISENEQYNSMLYDVLYNGGGVATGDINNDGLIDVYFTGNQVSDALYLNKGNFEFEDISSKAGIAKDLNWSSAVAMADVNNDGYLDIYVVKYLLPDDESRKNLLYINNKDNSFTEKGSEYGVDDQGFGTAANFIDYDKDGDLDLYVGNQMNASAFRKREAGSEIDYQYTDRLFRNDGNKFTDVTKAAGILNFGAALSVTMGDLNNDMLPDIYVANDYDEPDFLYYNNGDGTFTYGTNTSLKHISNFSMGSDIADINNDGLLDIFVADMSAEDNFRTKTTMSGMDPAKFFNLVDVGYNRQYMFNTLQLNNGNNTFSDVAQLIGVARTDWSWSVIMEDLDLDGHKDIYITNGIYRDTRNNDYRIWQVKERSKINAAAAAGDTKEQARLIYELANKAPISKVKNYAYRNKGSLTFENVSEEWNLDLLAWSGGAAIADLDNDGDPDLIVNNLNQSATVYKNNAAERGANFVKITGNSDSDIGAKIKATLDDGSQKYGEIKATRGYLSRSEPSLFLGIDKGKAISKLEVQWQDGNYLSMDKIQNRSTINLSKENASKGSISPEVKSLTFSNLTTKLGHKENVYDDYKREILLPHKMSHLGPTIEVADVNGDGLNDLFIGGSVGYPSELHIQNEKGDLDLSTQPSFVADKGAEDMDAKFVDIDGDNDLDLLIASGGNEFESNDSRYKDRLYINDGKGKFSKIKFESNKESSGCIASTDIDGDGDMDFFIGGRQVPGRYGQDASSTIYINENGKLIDKTKELCPELKGIGMVTDAEWTDVDKDGDQDLIFVGEWMPISTLVNEDGILKLTSIKNSNGWWNTIETADIDNDGDQDFLVGNLGYNIKFKASPDKPFKLFAKDFDGTGSHDVYLGFYDKDGTCYPVRGRQCSSQQMPFVAEKYDNYEKFANAGIEEILSGLTEDASIKQVETFASSWLINDGKGNLTMRELPIEAQIGPIFTFTKVKSEEGKEYFFAGGNFHHREVETTRSDASTGVILSYDPNTSELATTLSKDSGIYADGDVRDSKVLPLADGSKLLLVANNNAPLSVWRYN